MTRRSRADMIAATRSKLLATARQAFSAHGYFHASMEDITAQAGLSRGALYHHFGGKEGLLVGVVEQIEAEVSERLKLISESAPTAWEGFRLRCRAYLEMALESEIKRIILQDARAVLGGLPQTAQSSGILALQAALDRLIKEKIVVPLHSNIMAKMIYGAISEASFCIAASENDHELRLAESLNSLECLLSGLLMPTSSPVINTPRC